MDNNIKLVHINPMQTTNIFSKLTFCWYVKFCVKCIKYNLKLRDLYVNLPCDKSGKLASCLEKNWNEELNAARARNKNPSLLKAIRVTFLYRYMSWGLVLFFQYVIVRPIQPILLSIFIREFVILDNEASDSDNLQNVCVYGSLILLVTVIIIFMSHHLDLIFNQIGMQIRIACSSLIYRKILKLNQNSLDESTAGKVVNLLSNDVNRFDLVSVYLHHIWIMPFLTAVVTYYIWLQVGVAALAGIGSVLILTIPVHVFIGKLTSKLRLKIALRADNRVRKMAEIIFGIQVIKMYVWEIPFSRIIEYVRKRELETLARISYLRGIILSSFVYMQRTILYITIITYVSLGNEITAEKVFSMSLFFNLLQLSMSIFFPLATTLGAETLVSINRLEQFLTLNEKFVPVVINDQSKEICLKSIYASWTSNSELLNNINLHIPAGKLCAVVGPVGAGKSSLLHLLLGELVQNHGTIVVGGEIAYASQEPWLFASTVRKNILFGQKYDKLLYRAVIKVCSLERDFQLFSQGDQTMVGERGASLSGGQRARINLARTIYRNADIYLLDDPLSAVDTHVGKRLFEDCIKGYLKSKTRIIVTHQLQFLKYADHIVVLNQGKIEAQGTFQELSNSELDFTKILVASNDTEDVNRDVSKDILFRSSVGLRDSSVLYSISEQSVQMGGQDDRNEDEEVVYKASSSVYWEYAKSGGNIIVLIGLTLFLIGGQAFSNLSDFWITYWTQQTEKIDAIKNFIIDFEPFRLTNATRKNHEDAVIAKSSDNVNSNSLLLNYYVNIYTVLVVTSIVVLTVRSIYYYKVAMTASKNLHNRMFSSLLHVPMRFFDINPSGRILNRFSRDMGMIDEILPRMVLEAIQITLVMIGVLVMVCITSYYFIAIIAILGIGFQKLRKTYVRVAREVKHIEGIARSPVFSHVSASINGLTTLRSANAENILTDEFDSHQDTHTSAWYLTLVSIASFGIWLDFICFLFVSSVIVGFIILSQISSINGSYVGLALSQALILTGLVQYGIRQTAEVVSQMTSVERILEYTKLEKEEPQQTTLENIPPQPWPYRGEIEFCEVSVRYSKTEPPILRNLNFIIQSGEKIGIVGRTGAGKSSLISSLFRLSPLEGSIIIDHVDTNVIGLSDLRKKISIIPQEPVLFSATLRYNLDPFKDYSDSELWRVLEDVELGHVLTSLDFLVREGGSNFSVGQRQLLCLARAILRSNKILVLDEATANVDPKTDALIQQTIRRKFNDCTVLTVAHRLNTIMDADRVLVMEAGTVAEFDHPFKLLKNSNGLFSKMVEETGPSMTIQLKSMAEKSFNK